MCELLEAQRVGVFLIVSGGYMNRVDVDRDERRAVYRGVEVCIQRQHSRSVRSETQQ